MEPMLFSFFILLDLNECEFGNNTCDANAECFNLNGTYGCLCNQGFTGTGHICSGKPSSYAMLNVKVEKRDAIVTTPDIQSVVCHK